MLAAVFHGPNNMEVQKVPFSDSSKATLKVNACAVCGYDVRVYRNGHRKVSPPVILGHELCGEIQEDTNLGDSTRLKAGTRVAVCPIIPCLECPYCHAEEYNLCMNLREIGSTLNGGFAQYVTIPHQIVRIGGLVKVPDTLGDEEAALLEPLACCLNSFSMLSSVPSACPIVIIGDGPIALLHMQLFKKLAGARVVLVGKVPARMEKALSMGADAVFQYSDKAVGNVTDFAGARGAAIAVICASSPDAYEFAKKLLVKMAKSIFLQVCQADESSHWMPTGYTTTKSQF
ncbi:MAG TPA: alcohol dehydrogenase catalytic domain-containing protein [Nitrososphaera sp.]|nr:alcohol dehydrogenase catalytic domain-containing protein [Nitrososphaera sp.]